MNGATFGWLASVSRAIFSEAGPLVPAGMTTPLTMFFWLVEVIAGSLIIGAFHACTPLKVQPVNTLAMPITSGMP